MHLKLYLLHQKREIEKYKWIRGQELGRDPGEEAVREWVMKLGATYRKEYNEVFNKAIAETSHQCIEELKKKVPGVSDTLWDYIVEQIVETFTEVWIKDICSTQDATTKSHLEEI